MEIVRFREAQDIQKTFGSRIIRLGDSVDPVSPSTASILTLYHGSPVDPDTMGDYIKPQQAITRAVGGGNIPHGPSAVSTSSTLEFPSMRSLLHHKQPAFEGKKFQLHRRVVNGKSYMITSAESLQMLQDNAAEGYIYASFHPPHSAEPFEGREDLAEWRVPEPLCWDWAARTRINDLPDKLLVADASSDTVLNYIDTISERNIHPVEVGESIGIPVYDFSVWRQEHLS